MVEPIQTPESSVVLLGKLHEIAERMPGTVRKLEMTPADLAIAKGLDRDASDPKEGAINSEDTSTTKAMSEDALGRWVAGDPKHDMKVFGLTRQGDDGRREEYGFGYASQDDDEKDKRYDLGFKRRADFVRSEEELGNKQIFEYNFWADRGDEHFSEDAQELRHDTTVNWVAKHLLSLFEEHTTKQGDRNSLAFFMSVEKSDLKVDGRVLKELGFHSVNERGVDYNNPGRRGEDTLYVLTFDNFVEAMDSLDKKMQTPPPVGEDSRIETGGPTMYGEGKPGVEGTTPKLTAGLMRKWLRRIDEVMLQARQAQVPESGLRGFLETWAGAENRRFISLIRARFGADAKDSEGVTETRRLEHC